MTVAALLSPSFHRRIPGSFCASFCGYLALPFAFGWVALQMNTAVFFIIAVLA